MVYLGKSEKLVFNSQLLASKTGEKAVVHFEVIGPHSVTQHSSIYIKGDDVPKGKCTEPEFGWQENLETLSWQII